MRLTAEGLELIKKFEGCRLEAYKCPAGVWTIGFGHTGDVKPGQKLTQHQADVVLNYDLEKFTEGVTEMIDGLADNQFSACVSLAFNIGLTNFANSTLLKRLRAKDIPGAADQFPRWCKAAGKVLPGLVARRAAEKALFLGITETAS